jgi:hypothetical protein
VNISTGTIQESYPFSLRAYKKKEAFSNGATDLHMVTTRNSIVMFLAAEEAKTRNEIGI